MRGEANLGRSRANAIVLSDGKVSRNHARLDPVRSTYILTDLGSANGTFVNGVRITQPVRLRDADVPRELLPTIAEESMNDMWIETNPRKISGPQDILPLLEAAW